MFLYYCTNKKSCTSKEKLKEAARKKFKSVLTYRNHSEELIEVKRFIETIMHIVLVLVRGESTGMGEIWKTKGKAESI